MDIAHKLIASHAHSTGASAEDIDQLIYIQITRGVAMRDHVMPTDITPTVFVMASAMKLPSPAQRASGVACVTADDFRWKKAHIKSISLLGAVFARQISADVGAVETVMFRDGFLSEAAASNVWVVKYGVVIGPPKDQLVLEGIRYSLIEDICRAQGIPFELRRISREEVLDADELLLSSATKEVLAITTLDGQPVGHGDSKGRPGPVCTRLYAGYQQLIQETTA
jgi:D-alanine transaminase